MANVKATQGKLRGGISAGWTIFVVYQDDTMTAKYITSYDGFEGATNNPVDISLNNYEAPTEGIVNAKIAFASLDGDCNVAGDKLLFNANNNQNFTALSNSLRDGSNFFNSSISLENKFFVNRFPDSKNTLGYDAALFTIPNANNSVVPNGNKEATLRLQTSGDKLSMFFVAFNVESTAKTNENDEFDSDNILVSNENNILKVITYNGIIKFVQANANLLNDNFKTTSSFNRENRIRSLEAKKKIIEIQTLNGSNLTKDYYIIASVFKSNDEAKRFVTYLALKHIDASIFTNALNQCVYVYLKKTESQKEAIELFSSNMNNLYNERLDILAVNKNNAELISDTKEIEKSKSPYDIQIASIPNESSGYYIIANVFLHKENATKFMQQLKNEGLNPHVLINPETNFNYVYLDKVQLEQQAINLISSKINNSYLGKIWILSVNNTNRIITSNDY